MRKKWLFIIATIFTLVVIIFSLRPEKFIIVIDAGHGGADPGTTSSSGIHEKEINLSIAKKIAASLAKANYKVIMLRNDDSEISLQSRYEQANALNADFFISVHANAIENQPHIEGIQVLYYPDNEANNEQLAKVMLEQLLTTTKAQNKGVVARPDLAVLRGTTMKSLLIETGFLTNEQETKRLLQTSYQQKIADAVTQSLNRYANDGWLAKTKN